jgi:hypothetical protein
LRRSAEAGQRITKLEQEIGLPRADVSIERSVRRAAVIDLSKPFCRKRN